MPWIDGDALTPNNLNRLGGSVYDITTYGARVSDDDNTEQINDAAEAAWNARRSLVYVPPGPWAVAGTIDNYPGVTIMGFGLTGEYENGNPTPIAYSSLLYKPANGDPGPLIRQNFMSSAIRNLSLKYLHPSGASRGVVQMGSLTSTEIFVYSQVHDCHIIGARSNDTLSDISTCFGVYFTQGRASPSVARYFNFVTGNIITECDVGVRLNGNCNGNNVNNNIFRECTIDVDLNGNDHLCVENSFDGNQYFMQSVTTGATVFRLRNRAIKNVFMGHTAENFGAAYEIDSSSASGKTNLFLGQIAAATNSHAKGQDYLYARPLNISKYTEQYYISKADSDVDQHVNGAGTSIVFTEQITGTLPALGGSAGTAPDVDANSKEIINLGTYFSKAALTSFAANLKLWAYSPGNRGMHYIDVDFSYRNTSTAGAGPGQLCVTRVVNKGNASPEVVGLHFITGETTTVRPFSIVLTGGNNAGTFERISVKLTLDIIDYSTNVTQMDLFRAGVTFATSDIDAADETDAITLLTVADTVV